MFEEDLKEAVTTVVRKYPDITYLGAYNALQGVSYAILLELKLQREAEIMKDWGLKANGS